MEGCHVVGSGIVLANVNVSIISISVEHQREALNVAADMELCLSVSTNDGIVWR